MKFQINDIYQKMKIVDPQPLEVEEWELNQTYKFPHIMELNRVLDVSPFVYRTQDPIRSKVVLRWSLILKTPDKMTALLDFIAEQSAFVLMDGERDEWVLTSWFLDSAGQFRNEFEKRKLNTGLPYQWEMVNVSPKVRATLKLLLPTEGEGQKSH